MMSDIETELSKLEDNEGEPTDSKEYFHIVTRKSNGKYNGTSNSSVPGAKRGKKRGRKPKVLNIVDEEDERANNLQNGGAAAPLLMVNARERRKTSSRFNAFLEVLKGEKDFYIENENEDIVVTGKRGRGRKKKPQFPNQEMPTHHIFPDGHLSVLTESLDDVYDKTTCVIHVKETADEVQESLVHVSVEDGAAACNLNNTLQDILNFPSANSIRVVKNFERIEVKSEILENGMDDSQEERVVDIKDLNIEFEEPLFEMPDMSDVKTFQITESDNICVNENPDSPYSNIPTSDYEDFQDIKSESTDGAASKYRCKLCSNTYSTFEEAKCHAKTSHSSTIFEETNNGSNDLGYKCPDCKRQFPTEKGRNKHHLLMHLKNQPVHCPDCSLKFNSFRPLERHLKEIHDRNPVNFCDICEEEFVLGTSLEHHISISHPSKSKFNMVNYYSKQGITTKRVIQCPLCSEKLIGAKAFRLHHYKIHNGEPFSCKQCKYKTSSTSVLKRHLATVHKALDLSLYVCVHCKVGYQLPQDLEEHYISAHNKELVNLCPFCGEKFACLEMLRFHKGKHRAFTCDFCPLGFMKPEALDEHLTTVHKNDLSKEAEKLFEVNHLAVSADIEDKDVMTASPAEIASSTKILEINHDGSIEVKEKRVPLQDEIEEEPVQHSSNKVHHLHNTKEGNLQELDTNNPFKGFRIKDLPKKINCPICSKLLTTKFLRTHMRSHQGSLPHKCPKCSKAYAQGTLLRKHMKNKHYEEYLKLGNKMPKKKKVRCEYCELIFDDIYLLEDHLWSHIDVKSYECEMCRIKFGMKVNWMEHYKTHYFKEDKPCSNCDRSFKSVGFYREHIERCQSNWTCEECGFKCENPEMYRKHKKIEHTGGAVFYQCPHCEKSFYNKYGYEDHLITHSTDKQFTCNYCKKEFKRKRPLMEHISKVHIKSKYICNYCSLSFDTPVELQVHTKEHRRQQLACGECGAIYLSRQTLDNHIAVHHDVLTKDPFICMLCSEIFKKQIDWKTHLPKHTTDTLFVCQVNRCHKMFRKDALLRSHMARRHSYLEYYCHFCDRKFLLDSDLQKHITTHQEHLVLSCNMCQFSCTSKAQLNFHKLKNHEEKPYECSVCGTQTPKKESMVSHLTSVHNCQKPLEYILIRKWKCSLCEKIFLLQNTFMNHLEQHAVHGVSATGTLTKIPLIQQPVAPEAQNTISLKWEDLLSILRVEFLSSEDTSNNASDPLTMNTNNWQCMSCFFVASTEDSMRNHIISSPSCLQRIEEILTSKVNSVPLDTSEETLQAENSTNLQYILIDNSFPNDPALDSKDSVLLMDNNLQFVLSGTDLSELLNSSAGDSSSLPMLEISEDKLNITENKAYCSQSIPLDISTDLFSTDGGVLIQTDDGRLVIPEIGEGGVPSGMAQYHLVKEETNAEGTTESTYAILDGNLAGQEMSEIGQTQAFSIA